uniref:Uroplakin 1B n=1 Tax=Apteryx owenii TaxID=8824 RepID=A0A8B9Q787_APTOW
MKSVVLVSLKTVFCFHRLNEELKMAKDDNSVRIFQGLLVLGNVVIGVSGMCGIALTAECIFFVSDPHGLYPLLEAAENDDIYAAAWIGIFVGFALFSLANSVLFLLQYIILMLIIYAFEMASCITAATHRDFVSIAFLMCSFSYSAITLAHKDHSLLSPRSPGQNQCCGVHGPSDWQKYASAFRSTYSDADYPWPHQCCVMDARGSPVNLDGCKLGVPGYYNSNGCYDAISGPMNRQAWGVAWFGFAILCWTACLPLPLFPSPLCCLFFFCMRSL